ncbi:hypothetical protein LCGC14_2065560 [marine sediment metagenome]|uniref:Uncharacterized protein n=1 Tax=marine sediment metagenome TaxID=412755 RepID=A0A0F9F7B4_9ZZZZ
MARYRKLPVEIEAFQYHTGDADEAVFANWPDWAKAMLKHNVGGMVVARSNPKQRVIEAFPEHLVVHTLEGPMFAWDGDWIIKGVAGEIYPIKEKIFAETYEKVEAGD